MARPRNESMWLQFYALGKPPFESAWDFESPEQYFFTENLKKLLHKVDHFLEGAEPLVVITGEDGMGKTWLSQYLNRYIRTSTDNHVILLDVAPVGRRRDWMFWTIAGQLNLTVKRNIVEVLAEHLLALAAQNRKIVVIIDNVKVLQNVELLEEWRRLTNIQPDAHSWVSAIAMTTPREYANLEKEKAVSERISARMRLAPFSRQETYEYIRFRLLCANCRNPLFDREACDLIHEVSHGIPLRINLLCRQALIMGARQYAEHINAAVLHDALEWMRENGGLPDSRERQEAAFEWERQLPGAQDNLEALLHPDLLKKILIRASAEEQIVRELDALVEKAVFAGHVKARFDVIRPLAQARFMLRQGYVREALAKIKTIGEHLLPAGSNPG